MCAGDWGGDGTSDLLVVTAAGEKLAALLGPRNLAAFCVMPGTYGRGLLVTPQSGNGQAYAFE